MTTHFEYFTLNLLHSQKVHVLLNCGSHYPFAHLFGISSQLVKVYICSLDLKLGQRATRWGDYLYQ